MFENENRYIAKSVGGRIHLDVQIFIWQAIEWLKNEETASTCFVSYSIFNENSTSLNFIFKISSSTGSTLNIWSFIPFETTISSLNSWNG